MPKGVSLYLDLMRFAMALTVMVAHGHSKPYSGGILWQSSFYSQPAVIGFFVLSGFVIAHVTTTRERDGWVYLSSRVSRLYSVIIPALALTALLDALGWRLAPDFYATAPLDIFTDHAVGRYLATFLLASRFWFLRLLDGSAWADWVPGTNGPFWSLSFEAAYYLGFGIVMFTHGLRRYLALLAVVAVAGLSIVELAPTWLFGVLVYRQAGRYAPSRVVGWVLLALSLVGIVVVGPHDKWFGTTGPHDFNLPRDYTVAALVGLHVWAAHGVANDLARVLAPATTWLRWAGALTFPLYLCHRPTLQFVAAFPLAEVGGAVQTLWLYGCVIAVSVGVMVLSERFRSTLRGMLLAHRPARV